MVEHWVGYQEKLVWFQSRKDTGTGAGGHKLFRMLRSQDLEELQTGGA